MVAVAKQQELSSDEKKMELTEHLGELRARIMRIALYLALSGTICYYFFKPIYAFLFQPMQRAMQGHGEWKIVFTHFPEAFFAVLKLSAVAGLVLVLPFVTLEIYGFVAPALTKEEKKPLRVAVPMSVVLFALGVSLAYWTAQFAIKWFVSYVDLFPNGVLYQDPEKYIMFMLKMMAIFGAVFQLPVLLMFLAWVGLLRSAGMKKSWRTAVVGISVVGLFVTPSNDVFTMLVMIIPVIFLYLGSIWLVQIVERKRDKRLSER